MPALTEMLDDADPDTLALVAVLAAAEGPESLAAFMAARGGDGAKQFADTSQEEYSNDSIILAMLMAAYLDDEEAVQELRDLLHTDDGAQEFADRSKLVRKQITDKNGHKRIVYVRPGEAKADERPAGRSVPTTQNREQHADSETAVARAINDPHALSQDHIDLLADHVLALNKDRIRALVKQMGQNARGTKREVAQRLLDLVRGNRDPGKATGSALERGDTSTQLGEAWADYRESGQSSEAGARLRAANTEHERTKRAAGPDPKAALPQPPAVPGKPTLRGNNPKLVNWARGIRSKAIAAVEGTPQEKHAREYFEQMLDAETIVDLRDEHADNIAERARLAEPAKPAQKELTPDQADALDKQAAMDSLHGQRRQAEQFERDSAENRQERIAQQEAHLANMQQWAEDKPRSQAARDAVERASNRLETARAEPEPASRTRTPDAPAPTKPDANRPEETGFTGTAANGVRYVNGIPQKKAEEPDEEAVLPPEPDRSTAIKLPLPDDTKSRPNNISQKQGRADQFTSIDDYTELAFMPSAVRDQLAKLGVNGVRIYSNNDDFEKDLYDDLLVYERKKGTGRGGITPEYRTTETMKYHKGTHGLYLQGLPNVYVVVSQKLADTLKRRSQNDNPKYAMKHETPEDAARELALHELAHAIDQNRHGLGIEWGEIAKKELMGRNLFGRYIFTKQASSDFAPEREAFAEAIRVIYRSRDGADSFAKDFPKSAKYLKENNLWPRNANLE